MRQRLLLSTLLALCFSAPLALAQRQAPEIFSGRVVAITDGDTIGILRDGKEVKVRFHGVDAPELGQPVSEVAKTFVSDRVFGKQVVVNVTETDRYGRLIGVIRTGNSANTTATVSLNEDLVREGLAWWFHQYGEKDRHLALAEIAARSARKGLWKDEFPVPPWIFRHPEKVAGGDGSRPKQAGSSDGIGIPQPKPPFGAEPHSATVYVTRTGSKYHRSNCRHLKTRIASTLAGAQAKGLTACGVCRP